MTSTTRPRTVTLLGLGAIAGGIILQALGGNEAVPTVPPGVVLATIAGLATWWARPWWLANLGWLVPTVILVGGLLSDPGLLSTLTDPASPLVLLGGLIVIGGIAAAVMGGTVNVALMRRTTEDDR